MLRPTTRQESVSLETTKIIVLAVIPESGLAWQVDIICQLTNMVF